MLRPAVLLGLFALLCPQGELVTAHLLSRPYSAADLARLKSLLEQFEETLAGEEAAVRPEDYEDVRPETEESQASPEWERDRGEQGPVSGAKNPDEGSPARRSRLKDLLMSTRSQFTSACFGARMDRIGTYSGLGCNSKKG
ncbi:natriuretic peptides A-like [Megalops cyprinoides]|uniref:natriuretic peptides A-like n=1 Tax=Megalops cyprinoides TaxID=118141 RepID=UPI0018640ADF|nr:natriuretic peptides A-like [Megalops cyprinoides]